MYLKGILIICLSFLAMGCVGASSSIKEKEKEREATKAFEIEGKPHYYEEPKPINEVEVQEIKEEDNKQSKPNKK